MRTWKPDETEMLWGLPPAPVLHPASETETAEVLRSLPGAAVVPWGGGTKQAYTRPEQADLVLCTGRLRGVVDYDPKELVITARAGTPLVELEQAVAGAGQRLSFDPPRATGGATLGGTVATGAAGPGRFGAGGVRDALLAVRLVQSSGVPVKGGGKVVKSVAGYDLPRLAVGSLGCLGILTEVTLKVLPTPPARATLAARFPDTTAAAAWMQRVAASALTAAALEATGPGVAPAVPGGGPTGVWTLARFEGGPAGVRERVARAQSWLPAGAEAQLLPSAAADQAWCSLRELNWAACASSTGAGEQPWLLIKAGIPATAWPALVTNLGTGLWQAHAGGSYVWALLQDDLPALLTRLNLVRGAAEAAGGYAVVWDGALSARRQPDALGLPAGAAAVIDLLRQHLDPTGRLNPGRLGHLTVERVF